MIKKIILIFLISLSPFAGEYLLDSDNKCFGFDRVQVGTKEGNCIGMILSGNEGPVKPRKVIQIRAGLFLITDMVNWSTGNGILWEVEIEKSGPKLKKLFTGLDRPHGIQKGPDGLIYVGEADKIFRFNINNPAESKEIVISNIPSKGLHPLSEFIFTEDRRLILNVGAPTDQCLEDGKKPVYPCLDAQEQAALREYRMSADGSFPLVKNLAFGLRNSMGLVELSSGEIIQFNNGMDFNEDDTPLEEINLITDGANYGWPYCYENGKLNKSYKRSFFNRSLPKIDCSIYERPIGFLPARSAPLDAILYNGEMFSDLKGKILVSLHGYKESGQRVVALEVNTKDKSTGEYEEVVFGWTAKEGIRAKGAPVGLDVGEEGEIYIIDDKNKTLMVLARGDSSSSNNDDTEVITDEVRVLKLDQFKIIQSKVFSKHCIHCHVELSGSAQSVANYLIDSNLVKIGNAEDSDIYNRITGKGSNMMMPPNGINLKKEDADLVKKWIESISVQE